MKEGYAMSDIKITKERIDALLGEADIRTLTLFGKCTVVASYSLLASGSFRVS